MCKSGNFPHPILVVLLIYEMGFSSPANVLRTSLARGMEVDCFLSGFGVVVGVGDVVVADGDGLDVGGDDPEFAGIDGDGVVVENRLAIESGLALVALLGCGLQGGVRGCELGRERVPG